MSVPTEGVSPFASPRSRRSVAPRGCAGRSAGSGSSELEERCDRRPPPSERTVHSRMHRSSSSGRPNHGLHITDIGRHDRNPSASASMTDTGEPSDVDVKRSTSAAAKRSGTSSQVTFSSRSLETSWPRPRRASRTSSKRVVGLLRDGRVGRGRAVRASSSAGT